MRVALRAAFILFFAGRALAFDFDDFIDRVDDSLRYNALDDRLRVRVSGLLDLEGYYFSDPAPGLIDTDAHKLFNPRLSLFLDAQGGSVFYFFSQVRVDRGFDPGDHGLRVGLDEYALRITPWKDGLLNLQIGKFATVAGTWVERHLSWDNPFLNAPLPYENVTSASDFELSLPHSPLDPVTQKNKYEYIPLIWGPSYTTGFSLAGTVAKKLTYALELKNASLSSRPEVWDLTRRDFSHPTVTGHLSYQPDPRWKFGATASQGPFLTDAVERILPRGKSEDDYQQRVLGQDISFAWHHWQIWAEVFETRFEIPHFGNADSVTYYFEVKYKFSPQVSAAVRWNQAFFSRNPTRISSGRTWSRDISRFEAAVTRRLTSNAQIKLQYSFQDEARLGLSHSIGTQFTLRF
ncbi:MAG: hypothetical protein ABI839_05615 [Verrucomicrobiota bacterium]